MCKYTIMIGLDYGKMNVECGDNYNLAIQKYKEIKKDFYNTPATITLYNNEKHIEQFTTKTKNEYSFEKLYNELIDKIIQINEIGEELTKKEKKLAESKNNSYHMIEETDYDDLSMDILLDLKKNLTQRRLVKDENKEYYAWHECNCKIIEILKDYKEARHDKITGSKWNIYRSKYYKEGTNCKEKRISILKDLKINS